MIRTLPVLATLTLLFSATPASALKSTQKPGAPPTLARAAIIERPSATELVREANELWHIKEDYTSALAKFNSAVDADPEDCGTRLQRARFFEVLFAIVVPNDKAKFKARAQIDYEHITANDPDSLIAGVARDGLTRLAGERLIEAKQVECPEPAAETHARADSLYSTRQFADAAEAYETATAGCPAEAAWWVDFADTTYLLEDYRKAKELFLKALSIDPWNREAHRYLANTEIQLSHGNAAVHQLVLSVVSDPMYEAGWSALRTYAGAVGLKWNRVYGDKKAETGSADGTSWVAYGAAKANALDAPSGAATALAIEREAVKHALKAAAKERGPFWSMMARAEAAGFLDEAIFIHLLNGALAPEYQSFRETNAERLASYVETLILR